MVATNIYETIIPAEKLVWMGNMKKMEVVLHLIQSIIPNSLFMFIYGYILNGND